MVGPEFKVGDVVFVDNSTRRFVCATWAGVRLDHSLIIANGDCGTHAVSENSQRGEKKKLTAIVAEVQRICSGRPGPPVLIHSNPPPLLKPPRLGLHGLALA